MAEAPSERVKGGFHLAAFGLCSVLFAHNLAGWLTKPNAENGINALVYGCGIAFELRMVDRHYRRAA